MKTETFFLLSDYCIGINMSYKIQAVMQTGHINYSNIRRIFCGRETNCLIVSEGNTADTTLLVLLPEKFIRHI